MCGFWELGSSKYGGSLVSLIGFFSHQLLKETARFYDKKMKGSCPMFVITQQKLKVRSSKSKIQLEKAKFYKDL